MSLAADLKATRRELAELKAELPNFQALLDHNMSAADRLRAERAAPEAQAEARGRVNTARELLDQHRHDIQAAEQLVSDLQAQLDRDATVKRIKQLESDLEKGRETFAARAVDTFNALISAALDLRDQRQELMDADALINQLRDQLRADLKPHEAQALFAELGIPRPLGLMHYPPRAWGLRLFAANTSTPVKSRVVGILDQLLQDPAVTPDALKLERKAA